MMLPFVKQRRFNDVQQNAESGIQKIRSIPKICSFFHIDLSVQLGVRKQSSKDETI